MTAPERSDRSCNRQWRLRRRPVGRVEVSDFELCETEVPEPADGELLVRNRWFSLEPAMRGWIDDKPNYLPPVGIGAVMRGVTVGEVVSSRAEGYAVGDLVTGPLGWQEHAIAAPGVRKLPPGADPELALGPLGITGITAYFGLLEVGALAEGETVVVSGAAGATGSMAAQIAKRKGCRVVGIAGGPEKCAWLVDKAGVDAAIDYKREDVGERLAALCPDGVDVFFDNVGGGILDAVLGRIARGARIVVCGAITRFSSETLPPGPANYINILAQRARMQGFVVLDYAARFPEAMEAIAGWLAEGSIAWETDVQQGFENLPETLIRLYTGANFGKQLLEA